MPQSDSDSTLFAFEKLENGCVHNPWCLNVCIAQDDMLGETFRQFATCIVIGKNFVHVSGLRKLTKRVMRPRGNCVCI